MELTKASILKILAFILLISTTSTAFSQTWGEIFKQKQTQKKYLLEQVAALKVYAEYLKKGYDIASNGLRTVKDLSKGEFNLHQAFYSSLKTVSPAIRNNTKIIEIISFQLEITKAFNGIRYNEYLSATNEDYIKSVRDNVMNECASDLEELLLVITSGKIEMTDDERIKRLEKIYESMQDKSAFTQSYCNEVKLLIQQRSNEKQSINQLNKSYGIIN